MRNIQKISSSNVYDSVNFVKDIKNSIDLNYGNNTKDFTITSSSSHKNYKNSNTDNSLNVKIDNGRDIQEKNKNSKKIKILVIAPKILS